MFITTLALGMPGGFEWFIIAGIGLLIFGKRLPEVGRSLGKGIIEFKKGLTGIEDDVKTGLADASSNRPALQQQQQEPKFDPYTGKPLKESQAS